MDFIAPTWKDIHLIALKVAKTILKSRFKPDIIVGVFRGGWIAAKLISDAIGVHELGALEVKFYTEIGATSKKPIVTKPLVGDVTNKKVLLVDDVADTGRTLQVALEEVELHGPKIIRTATLYVKPRSIFIPDYYGETTSAWIIFPWEVREVLEELAKRKKIRSKEELFDMARNVGITDSQMLNELSEIMFTKLTGSDKREYSQ